MLKLGDFTWPNDPETLKVGYLRKVDVEAAENGLWTVTNVARMGRTFDGEGVFFGETAYEDFRSLAQYLYSGEKVTFVHPQWTQANVMLTELEVTEECRENVLHYRFRLVELPTYPS